MGRGGCTPEPQPSQRRSSCCFVMLWGARAARGFPSRWACFLPHRVPLCPMLLPTPDMFQQLRSAQGAARTCPPGMGLQSQHAQSVLMQHITALAQGPPVCAGGLLLGSKMSLDGK